MKQKFRVVSCAGCAASAIAYEFFEPTLWVRNERHYYPEKDDNVIFYNYQGEVFPLVVVHCNGNEPVYYGELRIVDNPKLTHRVFRARYVKPEKPQLSFSFLSQEEEEFPVANVLEVNPQVYYLDDEKLFFLSSKILAHAIHGRGFFPSRRVVKRRHIIELE